MNKIIGKNTIFPTRLIQGDFFAHPIIENWRELKPMPEKEVLIIVGDGASLVDDLIEFMKMAVGIPYDIMALNYSPLVLMAAGFKIDHFVAGDAHMKDMQDVAGWLPKETIKHCWNPGCKNFQVRWLRNTTQGWNGTTANLGMKIGIALDYTRLVLVGCPMDQSGNWYKPCIPGNDIKQHKDHSAHLWKWNEIACRPIGRFVRSMSGNTADLFGKPSARWLRFEPEIETILDPEREEENHNVRRTANA